MKHPQLGTARPEASRVQRDVEAGGDTSIFCSREVLRLADTPL